MPESVNLCSGVLVVTTSQHYLYFAGIALYGMKVRIG
jgi:hypothetical protein